MFMSYDTFIFKMSSVQLKIYNMTSFIGIKIHYFKENSKYHSSEKS